MEMDLASKLNSEIAVDIQTIASDTTTVGNIVDSQDYESLSFILATGTVTDGDYALILEESDDSGLSGSNVVAAADIVGDLPAFTADTDDDATLHCGYVGKKRYVRASIVSTNFAATGAVIGAVAVKGNALKVPTITKA